MRIGPEVSSWASPRAESGPHGAEGFDVRLSGRRTGPPRCSPASASSPEGGPCSSPAQPTLDLEIVRVGLKHHPLTATAALVWSDYLARRLGGGTARQAADPRDATAPAYPCPALIAERSQLAGFSCARSRRGSGPYPASSTIASPCGHAIRPRECPFQPGQDEHPPNTRRSPDHVDPAAL